MAAAWARDTVIFADVAASASRLGDFGRWVVHASAQLTHAAVSTIALATGARVVEHAAFSTWLQPRLMPTRRWLVLDPLVSCAGEVPTLCGVTLHRVLTAQGFRMAVDADPASFRGIDGANIGIVDDVASTGRTLSAACELIHHAGGRVTDIVVAAATAEARAALMRDYPEARWTQFVEGDVAAVHMRDVCPGVPFSGRRQDQLAPIPTINGLVRLRLPPMVITGGIWERLWANAATRATMEESRRQFLSRFARAVGREPLVSDFPLLGPDLDLVVYTSAPTGPDAILASVLL